MGRYRECAVFTGEIPGVRCIYRWDTGSALYLPVISRYRWCSIQVETYSSCSSSIPAVPLVTGCSTRSRLTGTPGWRTLEPLQITSWRFISIRLFVQQPTHANNQENLKAPYYCSFVKGIHRRPMDSPSKEPVKWNMFPWQGVTKWWDRMGLFSWRSLLQLVFMYALA